MNSLKLFLVFIAVALGASAAYAQQQPRAAVYLAIVKARSPAADQGLQDWSQAFKRGLDVALYDAMSTAFGGVTIEVQKADFDSAPSIGRLQNLRRQREAIYIVSAVAAHSGDDTTISSTVVLDELSGGLPTVFEIRQRVNLNDYRVDRDALTVLTLYGLANEAGLLGRVAAACKLLARANLMVPEANLVEAPLASLPGLIRDGQRSRSCE